MKQLAGNSIKFLLRQIDVVGLLPNYIKGIVQIIVQSYKGHVTIVPSPTLTDYSNLLENVTPQNCQKAFWNTYVQSLSKMAHIKSFFAIEREFDRYYQLLKSQLRDGSDLTDVRVSDELRMTASRTYDQSKAWENPNLKVPIEKAHLSMTSREDPYLYEQLCTKHDAF